MFFSGGVDDASSWKTTLRDEEYWQVNLMGYNESQLREALFSLYYWTPGGLNLGFKEVI